MKEKKDLKVILVTGGAGFIGSNFIHYIIKKRKDILIVTLDKLTYAGNLENLKDVENNKNYTFIKGDVCDKDLVEEIFDKYNPDFVLNFAAESHVDRSIIDPNMFVKTNVLGTGNLLNIAKDKWNKKSWDYRRFIQVSTDEVYGSLPENNSEIKFTELSPLEPRSPYSASKASSDHLAISFYHTFGFPIIVTRSSNNYGPFQFPEKLIPLMINNAIRNKSLPVYGDGKNIRDWIFVEDNCSATRAVLEKGKPGNIYNIGASNEWKNIDIVKLILDILEKPYSLIEYIKDRPGHDRRYALDNKKIINELGWKPKYKFEQKIKDTVEWYLNNQDWVKNVITKEYLNYYKKNYENR